MSYEAWRISFQSSEQAALASFRECMELRAQLAAAEARAERHRAALAELVALKDIKVRLAECWPDDPEIPFLMREYSTRKGAAWVGARAALAEGEAG